MQRIPMASGYAGTGSSAYASYQQVADGGGGGGGGGMLKRSALELESQQQMQQALLLRSVKQRTNCSPAEVSLSSSSSGFNFRNPYPQPEISFLESDKKSSMRNQLQELERQLLLDDDDDAVSVAAGSAVTSSEWSEAMDRLLSPPPPAPMIHSNAPSPSPSPSTSTSSSASSSASCSPTLSASRQLLLDTAAAIADGNFDTAASNLAALKRAANARGDPDQRLTAMMLSALLNRTSPSSPSSPAAHPFAELCSLEHQTATQLMYEISPCFKLGLMAANLAILDATRGNPKIHVIDFDIGQGGQYAALIHAIAAERSRQIPSLPPPSLKITAVSDPAFPFATASNLKLIGDKIAKLSNRLGLDVRFRIVDRRTSELDATTLGREPGEALAVNFSFVLSKIADESVSPANPRDELLRRVRSLGPKVVTVVEQEINFNTAPFPARFTEACSYYGSLLDSLDATAGRDSAERARVEACIGRKVANAVAREGPDRLERPEVFGKWRARMGMAGLRPVELGPAVVEPVRSRFGSYRSVPGFTFKEEAGGLGFGWMGRVLTVASAWR